MKKNTIQYLVDFVNEYINDELGGEEHAKQEMIDARDELVAELTKGKAKADANRAIYDEIHDAVVKTLQGATNALTAQELADKTGYAKGKIVYGLTNYWNNEIEKTEGKVNTYALKE